MATVNMQESSKNRPGRRFEALHEVSLYPAAEKAAATLPGSSGGILLVPEMTGPLGVPDFLAYVGGIAQLNKRILSGIPPILSELDCNILSQLYPARPRAISVVASQLQMSENDIDARMTRLIRIDAAMRTPTGLYRRNPALTPGGTLFALETKIRDWRRALRQARGYRTWTNNYVLVLGGIGMKAQASVRAEVELDQAGLVVDGTWVRKPSPRKISSIRRILGFEHLIAALGNYQPS